MAHTISELTWLEHFLQEIGFLVSTPIHLFLYIAIIKLPFMKSKDQLADVFTKSLSHSQLKFICSILGLYYIY
jgi:hypothetical protein